MGLAEASKAGPHGFPADTGGWREGEAPAGQDGGAQSLSSSGVHGDVTSGALG